MAWFGVFIYVVLARYLARALLTEQSEETKEKGDKEREEYKRVEMGLKKYAKERRWRSIELISTTYMVSFFQQGDGRVTTFLSECTLPPCLYNLTSLQLLDLSKNYFTWNKMHYNET